MADKEEEGLELEPTKPLDLSKFTMNEVVTDRSRDKAGIAKQLSVIAMWALVGLLVAWGLVKLNDLTIRKGGTGDSLAPNSGSRSADAEFEESVVNRVPALMLLVKGVNLDGDTRMVAELLPMLPAAGGKERPSAKTDWANAGERLMEEFVDHRPGKVLELDLVVNGHAVGILRYDPVTKKTTSQYGDNLALPTHEEEGGHHHHHGGADLDAHE